MADRVDVSEGEVYALADALRAAGTGVDAGAVTVGGVDDLPIRKRDLKDFFSTAESGEAISGWPREDLRGVGWAFIARVMGPACKGVGMVAVDFLTGVEGAEGAGDVCLDETTGCCWTCDELPSRCCVPGVSSRRSNDSARACCLVALTADDGVTAPPADTSLPRLEGVETDRGMPPMTGLPSRMLSREGRLLGPRL